METEGLWYGNDWKLFRPEVMFVQDRATRLPGRLEIVQIKKQQSPSGSSRQATVVLDLF